MSGSGSSQARLIGVFVLVLIISLAELAALILDYQNNRYLREYVSDNLGTIVAAAIGLVVVASVAGYVRFDKKNETLSSNP
jgi:amino acid permease